MRMNTKKRIKQLIEEILTEIDVETSKIDNLDGFCDGEYIGMMEAAEIITNIGSKYLKEDKEEGH